MAICNFRTQRRNILRGLASAALVTVWLFGAVSSGTSADNDRYSAVALSPSSMIGGWPGWLSSEAAAEAGALAVCGRESSDCQLILTVRNQCFAVAKSRTAWGIGGGPVAATAKAEAIRNCQAKGAACSITNSECPYRSAAPVYVQTQPRSAWALAQSSLSKCDRLSFVTPGMALWAYGYSKATGYSNATPQSVITILHQLAGSSIPGSTISGSAKGLLDSIDESRRDCLESLVRSGR